MAHPERDLAQGRERFTQRAWVDADEILSRVDREIGLEPADLERLSTCAYMLGDGDRHRELLERAHNGYLSADDRSAALRCAFWAGMDLVQRAEVAQASGWLGRARRLLDALGGDRVERGYLLLPSVLESASKGDVEAAASLARQAAQIGWRFGDRDLFALAAKDEGLLLVTSGLTSQGLRLLDEAMLVARDGELSPIVTGHVYCGVVLGCQLANEPGRAREWTAVLSGWCEDQPDLVAFTGRCLVHRAEIKQLDGSWAEAIEEARRAEQRSLASGNTAAAGEALYRRAELHRLRGEIDEAEAAYRDASRRGREPQPGLSLCRLAQGRTAAALAAIRRALAETASGSERLHLLPAAAEITVAAGELEEARSIVDELTELIDDDAGAFLAATLGHVNGAVLLACGDSRAALPALRRAAGLWQEVGAPYDVARSRELTGLACRALGDDDGAALELEAARDGFQRLGALPDLKRMEAHERGARQAHGLTERELEVLRLVAAGDSNRQIAEILVISEHTVARHLQNIYAKLGVSSRTAASAFAFERQLV